MKNRIVIAVLAFLMTALGVTVATPASAHPGHGWFVNKDTSDSFYVNYTYSGVSYWRWVGPGGTVDAGHTSDVSAFKVPSGRTARYSIYYKGTLTGTQSRVGPSTVYIGNDYSYHAVLN